MQAMDMAENIEESASPPNSPVLGERSWSKSRILNKLLQVFHLALAFGTFLVGLVEFCIEPTIFDIFGRRSDQRAEVPDVLFKNGTFTDKSLVHILDAPILFLFLMHMLSVVWLKGRGRFAWLISGCHFGCILVFVLVNAVFTRVFLDWRYFYTRAVTIIVDVIIISFDWTFIIVTLLHIRGWFPFKVNKKHMVVPYHERHSTQRVIVVLWNFVALFLVMTLCLLVWFSRLYMSWACVKDKTEIRLMCQFTNLVQCWPCDRSSSHCDLGNITQCYREDQTNVEANVIRCIKPLYTVDDFENAFCVFNYNIGPFTFVTVFSYVGGIYFFMRTVLNALVKCLYNILYIAIHCCARILHRHILKQPYSPESTTVNNGEEDSPTGNAETKPLMNTDPRVSLLGPLPHFKLNKHKV